MSTFHTPMLETLRIETKIQSLTVVVLGIPLVRVILYHRHSKSGNNTNSPIQDVSSTCQCHHHSQQRSEARAKSRRNGAQKLQHPSKTAMNAFMHPPEPPRPGMVMPEGTMAVFITPPINPSIIQVTTTQTTSYPQELGQSYIVVVNEGYECRIAGAPECAVRWFSLSKTSDEPTEANRAIQASKDIYRNT